MRVDCHEVHFPDSSMEEKLQIPHYPVLVYELLC